MSETPFFLVFVLAQNMLLAQFLSQAFGSILLFPLRHAGVQPSAMPADVCSLLAEAQRNVLPQSHRARSMSSCCVKTLRARSRFSRFFFVLFFFVFFWKSWARNVNLRKWLNVRLILKVCVYIVKRHRARSDTCYRLNIFQFFFRRAPGEKNIEPVTRRWASNETLSPYAGLSA